LKQALRTQNFFYRKHSTEVLSAPVFFGVRSGSMFARLLILLLPFKNGSIPDRPEWFAVVEAFARARSAAKPARLCGIPGGLWLCRANAQVAEWLMAADCKSAALRSYGGSNPPLCTMIFEG
jgi:hypothetical protein